MASSDALPSILILGGILDGTASSLLTYLWDDPQSTSSGSSLLKSFKSSTSSSKNNIRRARYIRLVDKFLIVPQSDTFLKWIHPDARKVLKEGYMNGVEYMQANLTNAESRTKVFKAPLSNNDEETAFDIVIDLTGCGNMVTSSGSSASEEVMAEAAKQTGLLGVEALKYGGVGAYVRVVDAFVTQPRKQCPLKEEDNLARPTNLVSKWAWEGTRALADLEDLNLVIARTANPCGPTSLTGLTPRLTIASVYSYLSSSGSSSSSSTPLEFLWGKDLVLEHIHMYDLSSALYVLAQWMRSNTVKTREKANNLAGVNLGLARPAALPSDEEALRLGSKKDGAKDLDKIDKLDGLPERDKKIIAPLFNITDGSGITQEEIGKIVEKIMPGIKVDYYSAVTNALAKMNMNEVYEAAEEKHMEPWLEMLSLSKPPILNTPLTPILPPSLLRKNRCHLDGNKIQQLTDWKPRFKKIEIEEVRKCIEVWKDDAIWPNVKPKKK